MGIYQMYSKRQKYNAEREHIEIEILQLELKEAQARVAEAEANAEEARARANYTLLLSRPSRQYPVVLMNDGLEWVCKLTGHSDPSRDLSATGECPEKALVAFDLAWYGVSNE